jgi:hypothetical protein
MLARPLFHLRTAIVLILLAVGVVVAGTWGWRQMTEPFPAKAQAAICVDTAVPSGTRVYPAQVVVTVLNAGPRAGLASRTISAFTDAGFVAGNSGNAPVHARVKRAAIWSNEPNNPAVRLVASWLHKPTMINRSVDQPGVVVLVGKHFRQVSGGRKFTVAATDTSICSPPVD